MMAMAQPVGDLLREWRQRRRMSQLDLASEAEISTRHLSFLETGRALPSRDMVLHLAEQLEVPLHERNILLVAGEHPKFVSNGYMAECVRALHAEVPSISRGRSAQSAPPRPARRSRS